MSIEQDDTPGLPPTTSMAEALPRTLKNGPQEGVNYPNKVDYCGGLNIYKNYDYDFFKKILFNIL
ncbi:hypothetical protein BLA29_012581 [Euroglyphus maynei]|uniref:Uncharacterized protein n=1 Tax=Euroglyphus maynei TaxID=6958 RepID=A0A1Y3ANG6_EURMA|nr:hypothetical protein BLA29_012581 [Euroglyphus maynei]